MCWSGEQGLTGGIRNLGVTPGVGQEKVGATNIWMKGPKSKEVRADFPGVPPAFASD